MTNRASDWWARKLNDQPASTPRVSTPPVQAPIRFPVTVPRHEYPQPVNAQQQVLDPTRAPTDQISMGEAIGMWRGGEAMRTEGNFTCPSCGSPRVTARAKGNTIMGANGGMAAPAPRCFECGWNGKYEQADASNWA